MRVRRLLLRLSEFELWQEFPEAPLSLFRAVRAPPCTWIRGRRPQWARAFADRGGTSLFGPGPYLHLPYADGDLDDPLEVRVRCPWGTPGTTAPLTLLADAPPAWWRAQEVYPTLVRARFGFLATDLRARVTHVALRPIRPAPPPQHRYGPWRWEVTLVRV